MTNDDDRFTGTRLLPCFAPSISELADAICVAAKPGGSDGASPRNAETHLLTIRANAAKNSPGLYDALDAVRSAVHTVEEIARRQEMLVPHHEKLLALQLRF